MPPTDAVRVFISYSHDSPEHERRTFDLADKLRSEGVDCELDQFEPAPPEGWQRWMAQQVREADYVLVVCTASYHRRVTGREREGVGLGAIWEGGLITQELYDNGGRNDKFIPVVFNAGDTKEIPAFLKQTTYYDIADPSQYDALYRRLTAQPRIVRRPLGPVRRLGVDAPRAAEQDVGVVRTTADFRDAPAEQLRPAPPAGPDSGSWPPGLALIRAPSGSMHFLPLLSVDVSAVITAVLLPGRSEDRVYLESLVSGRFNVPTIDFAFGFSAERARLTSATRTFDGGSDRYTLTLAPEPGAQRSIMEMSTPGYSADEIATLRARRILLDEHLPASTERSQGFGSGSMLESLVRGSKRW
jgi:hypothetical protein